MLTMMLPINARVAKAAAVELGKKLGLVDPEVISVEDMQDAEGTRIELKGRVDFDIDLTTLKSRLNRITCPTRSSMKNSRAKAVT